MKRSKKALIGMMLAGTMLFMSACSGNDGSAAPAAEEGAKQEAEAAAEAVDQAEEAAAETADQAAVSADQTAETAEAAAEPAAEAAADTADDESLVINYQSSIGYAPLLVMKDQGFIESNYPGNISVSWVEMSNGAEVNEALISGDLDVGSMGVPVAITGIMAGSPYRIAFGLASQPYAILSNDPEIKTLADIKDTDQIAITNINSQPHILLAMAAKKELGDARALDSNLTKLGNADGYAAIVSGAVNCHMVISPYNFMEVASEDADIHELEIDPSVWPAENTALVSVVPESLKNDRPQVYDALIKAVDQANEFIKENPEKTAEILAEGYDATPEEILTWMQDERSSYSSKLCGVMNMAQFMVEEGFLDEGPSSIQDLVYDNVEGN